MYLLECSKDQGGEMNSRENKTTEIWHNLINLSMMPEAIQPSEHDTER